MYANITLNKHCQINHTKSRSSHNTSINNHLLIASGSVHSTWSSCFICTNWEFPFLRIQLNYNIILSVLPFVAEFGNPLTHDITDLTNLPEPYNRIIKQLSKLSLEAFNNNKPTFTLDEIISTCPDIAAIPGAINGFGLLQAVQHFGLHTKR